MFFTQKVEIRTTEVKSVQVSNISTANNKVANKTIYKNVSRPSQISNKDCLFKDLIYKYFGEANGRIATAIALSESGCNATSVNWNDAKITGMPSSGIFQINAPQYNWNWSDPETNIARAYDMYSRRSWSPWSVWKNNSYLRNL